MSREQGDLQLESKTQIQGAHKDELPEKICEVNPAIFIVERLRQLHTTSPIYHLAGKFESAAQTNLRNSGVSVSTVKVAVSTSVENGMESMLILRVTRFNSIWE